MPVVWQISVLHLTNQRSLIRGTLLKYAPYHYDKKVSGFRNFLKIGRSYFTATYANKEIRVTVGANELHSSTDKDGYFELIANGGHQDEIKVFLPGSEVPVEHVQDYPLVFQESLSKLGVISDIDDTIVVSHTANFFKRIRTLAFKVPNKRVGIPFTRSVFEKAKKQNACFFYISRSESNLLGALIAFIRHNGLPKGMIFLTPYLSFLRLFNPKKDVNYKISHIRFLIEHAGIERYILLGDDSQHDVRIYRDVVKLFPDKIQQVYIRKTRQKLSASRQQMMDDLKSSGGPVTYFSADDELDVMET